LYAAGRSAHNGMHGEGLLPGNLTLDDLVSGNAAGTHAGNWVQETAFGGSNLVEKEIIKSQNKIQNLHSSDGNSVGQTAATLASIMSSCVNGSRDENSLATAASSLAELKSAGIKITDSSSVMNTELSTALKLEGMISVAEQISKS